MKNFLSRLWWTFKILLKDEYTIGFATGFMIAFLLFGCTTTPDKWTKKDYVLHTVMTSAMAVDWLQTRYIAEHPDKYYETNPILGKHPSKTEVDLYFLGSWLVTTGIVHFTKEKYRFIPQVGHTALSIKCIIHNDSIGIGMTF